MLFVIQFSWFNLSIFNAFFCVKMLQETHYTLKDMHNLCTLNVYKKPLRNESVTLIALQSDYSVVDLDMFLK